MTHRRLGALALCLAAWQATAQTTLHVAPGGNDAWSGRLPAPNADRSDGPLATLPAAQRAVRQALAATGRRAPVTVLLRRGRHELSQPLVFSPADSGSAAAPVTWAAFPGERPVVSGGRRVTGWRRDGDRWTTTIPEARNGGWKFTQLFVNGVRRTRARTPNQGFLTIDRYLGKPGGAEADQSKTAFGFKPGDLAAWPDLDQAMVLVYHSWETSLLPVKSVDVAKRVVEFGGPSCWHFGYWGPGQRYHVENVRAALDAPGEWYLDYRTGELTYLALPNEDLERAEVIAPVTAELIRLGGETAVGLPVAHVALRGISFQHADWQLEPTGHSDPQAVYTLPAAINAVGAIACTVTDCEFAHLGRYALWLRRGCRDWRVERNHLWDLGGGGLRVGEMAMPGDDTQVCGGHVLDNNYVHDWGVVYAGSVGILVGQSSDNKITHNEVSDGTYSGMSLGWNWGPGPTAVHDNLVADNHIHHVLRGLLSDGGGIYTLGTSTGSVLRGNVIHDVFSYSQPLLAWGIYLDAESNHLTIEDNLCYNLQNGGLMMHNGAFANVVRNNIFARASQELVWRSPATVAIPNRFERNICQVTQGLLFLGDGVPDTKSVWDQNLYWRADGRDLEFMDETFAEWQARGIDRGSLVADPEFMDAAHDDFRLRPSSPALTRLGFRPVNHAAAGLYGDAAWVALPKRQTYPPTVMPPDRSTALERVDDDFESTPPGQPPALAVSSLGPVPGGAIAVTEERAASGRHSLKVQDAPGLKHVWDPHLFYQPRLRKGLAHLQFKLNFCPGAEAWMEWRSGGSPFLTGPSFKVDAQGNLRAGDQVLMPLPANQWLAFEVTCRLGKHAIGTYDLHVTLPAGTTREFKGLKCDPRFNRLAWVGFVSLADAATVFYLDDVKLFAEPLD